MSCFSSITIDPKWLPQGLQNIGTWQTKDLPDDESQQFPYDNYYDGAIRHDGTFIREDGMWNPSLTGWIALSADIIYPAHDICIRFERGVVAEIIVDDETPGDIATVERGWSTLPGWRNQ